MRKVKDTIWWLNIFFILASASVIGFLIWLGIVTDQRNKARSYANQFFYETQVLRDSLQWYKGQEQLREQEIEDNLTALIHALIIVETEGQSNPEQAVGDRGKAIGVLQLHPGVIEDLRVAGYDYSLEDRYDREKSVEMWLKWMEIWVPDKNISSMIKRHNPRISWTQHQRIIRLMEIIRDGNSGRGTTK